MTEVWATTSASVKEVKFNWKINDFAVVESVISSPQFNVGNRKCILRINERHVHNVNLTVDGVRQNQADYHILYMNVDLGEDKIPICGFLSIDTEGNKISGILGNPPSLLRENAMFPFKIQTSQIVVDPNIDHYFCISRQATQVDIRVKLYFPNPITNTISLEPEKEAAGVAELIADMRALLNRSAENADFSIKCGGKVFPCHEAILRARSTVMDAMFQNEMAEASARSLVMVDVGPDTVAAILEYMYTGGITLELIIIIIFIIVCDKEGLITSTLKVDNMKELIYIADKYDMAGLLDLCFRKLPEIGDDMIVDFLFMADKHNLVEYKKQVMMRIIMNKSKYIEDQEFMEKLKELPHLLLELFKL